MAAFVSWVELKVGDQQTGSGSYNGVVSWIELQTGVSQTEAYVSWVELQTGAAVVELSASLAASSRLVVDLLATDHGGGRKKRKKKQISIEPRSLQEQLRELNPLIRVEWEKSSKTKEYKDIPIEVAEFVLKRVDVSVTPKPYVAKSPPVPGMGVGKAGAFIESLKKIPEGFVEEADDDLILVALMELIDD